MQYSTSFLCRVSLALALGCCAMLATPRGSNAAPDQTLGMAFMAALVASDGTLLSGSGVTSTSRAGTGNYDISFDRNVSGCIAVADAPRFFDDIGPGSAENELHVVIWRITSVSAGGNGFVASDAPFNLMVFCAK